MSRSREQLQLLFLLAGCARRRSSLAADARAHLERTDFDRFASDLAERRLLPLIGSRAIETAPDLVPDSFRAAVTQAIAVTRARGLFIEVTTARLVRSLSEAGIRTLALKGPGLAIEAHGDLGMRDTSDIDLLVAVENLEAAAETLRSQGYTRVSGVRAQKGLPHLHHELSHRTLPPVDLHWRVYWYESAFSAQLLQNAQPGEDGLLRPERADLVTSLLLFYARDGFHGVRLAADLAAWWDRHGESLGDEFLEPYARAFPELREPLDAATAVVERLTGVPAGRWLARAAPPSRRVATAARLADWTQAGDLDQMSANISLVAALLRPPGSLPEFARRELVLEDRGMGANVMHAAKLAARCGIALWKVRGSRPWVEAPAGAADAVAVG